MYNCVAPTMKDQKSFEVIVQNCTPEKKVVDKLFQRSEARVAELGRKKCEKDAESSVYEQTDYFNATFSYQRQQIQSKLLRAATVPKEKLMAHFDDIVRDFQELQKFLADSTLFLPTYDIKKGQESLKVLQDEIHAAQDEFLPKKKFVFKNKKKQQQVLVNGTRPPVSLIRADSISTSDPFLMQSLCGFRDMADHHTLVKTREEIDGQDLGFHNLRNCTVKLYGAPGTVFISGLVDCRILGGPVSTSVFVENCVGCTFLFACQQMRVHSTTDCAFHLHVSSRSIIEDCSGLCFAPYSREYQGMEGDFARAGLDRSVNNWESVDDFNWLVIGTQSPNWGVLLDRGGECDGTWS